MNLKQTGIFSGPNPNVLDPIWHFFNRGRVLNVAAANFESESMNKTGGRRKLRKLFKTSASAAS